MTLSLDDFLARLNESGLLNSAEVRDLLDQWTAARPPPDTQSFAQDLVRQKKLTKFQAEQLYAGKGKSLTLGNYVILDKLGQGGMGMVLKARHRRMDRLVAIKVMSPTAVNTPDALKRFHREVQAAAKLRHPNIVAADDADEAKGTHFLVLEYVEGSDLSVLVKKHGPLPIEQAVQCIIQAARGLEFAHEQGVIHRDIKPANLLIDAKGTVKILDMGLARIEGAVGGSSEGAGLTSTGTIMGTVDYMSPEQAMDTKHADARSDIYSLGCTLYYLLTGKAVYDGDTIMKKLMAHQHTPIPSIVADAASVRAIAGSSDASSVGHALDAVFRRMVAKKPEDRPQTMTHVMAELERCLSGGSPTIAIRPNSSTSASGVGSGNELQDFLRLIGGEEGSTATSAAPAGSKGTAVAPSSVEAETMISSAGDGGTDPRTEQSLIIKRSGEPLGVSPRTVRGLTPNGLPSSQKMKMVLLSSIAAVVVLLGIVFAMRSKSGALHLEIKDELIEVTIGETGRVVKGVTEQDLSLAVGEHVLHIKREDLAFDTDPIELKKGEPVSITVERVGRRVRAMQGSTLLGRKESPKSKDKTTVSSASPDFALDFAIGTSQSKIEIPLASLDPNQPWTLEGYIQPADLPDHNQGLPAIFSGDAWQINLNHWSMRLVEQSAPAGTDRSENVLATSSVESLRGKRFHVAAVYGDKLAQFFINGKLVGGAPSKFLPKQNLGKLILGARFSGTMDEWRISKVGRYGKDFTPPQRYETDADTLALYHFDEGTGDVLKDSSGKNNHGKIVGAKWVRSDSGLVVSDDPDRRAAEWVLKVGGGVRVREVNQTNPGAPLAPGDKLPAGRFKVQSVHLSYRDEFVTDNTLENLRGLTEIKDLNLLACRSFTDRSLKLIGTLKSLQSLALVATEVTDDGIKDLRGLSELTTLALNGTRVTGRGLESLRDLQKLRVLEVADINSSEAVVEIAKGAWPELNRLGLPGTILTDSGATGLANLPTLSRLELVLYQASDDQLRRLAPLQKLTILSLVNGSSLSDAGLEHLRPLTNLKILGLRNTQVTSAGVAKLQQALPNCKIEWDGVKTVTGDVPAANPVASQVRVVDLLVLVDLKRDVLAGEWTREADGLTLKQLRDFNNTPRVQLPYQPPEEYDFEIEFTPKSGNGTVEQILSSKSRSFAWVLNSVLSAGVKAGLESMDGTMLNDRKDGTAMRPKLLENGQARFRSRVEVRKGSVRGFLNDELLVDWGGTVTRLDIGKRNALRDTLHLGLSASDRAVTFHSVTVREVSGTGKLLTTDAGWLELFNGKDLTGWKTMGVNGWTVENGVLLGKTATGDNGWLMSDREFTDYELELEYKIGPGSNSGIFLRAWPEGNISGSEFREIQLLDDEAPAFASMGADRRTGSLFGLVAPQTAPKVPANQWHRVRVHLQGQQLQLTINDIAVLKHTLTDLRPSGRIGLQLYPTQVEFRNIRVRPLGPAVGGPKP